MSKTKRDLVDELHRPARINFDRRRTIIKGLDDLWQADLAEFSFYARYNKGYKFILVVIDCFSKYLWTRALKDKSSKSVRAAFSEIFQGPRTPNNLHTDNGTEFYNAPMKVLLAKYSVNHYSTYTKIKASMAERVIRTIKNNLYRAFSLRGRYVWIDILDDITAEYNNRKHRTIGMSPRDVTKNHEQRLLDTVYSHIKISGRRKFSVGDVVRISKQKGAFAKGYTPNWSAELFKVMQVRITDPATYLLEDMHGDPILGAFYNEELQTAKHPDSYLVEKILKRKGSKVFVKWLGHADSFNSWIDKADVL